MGNNIDTQTHRKLVTWLVAQSMIIIFAAIVSFLSVELIANYFFVIPEKKEGFYQILYRSGGTIVPMAVILGLINNSLSRIIYKYVETIADALKKIASGDFSIQLNPNKAGPFSKVYENINKTADELSNVELLKKDFLNNYSHEFKTPITSIKGFAELLLQEDLEEETKREYLAIIAEESNRLAQMADTTILLSKLNSQSIITDKINYAMDEQIRKCAILFLQQAKEKKIHFNINLENCYYNGNENLMKHVWINLLSNAFKFTPQNGEVTINLKKSEENVVVEVSDNGLGMKEEVKQNIFSQYYQADSNQEQKGLGLGLSIVEKIVDLCEGSIEVKSIENKGTTFIIILPSYQ